MENIKGSRYRLIMEEQEIKDPSLTLFPGIYSDFNDKWTIKKFKQKFKIEVVKYDKSEMEFDLIGVHPSIVNAFRRIMLSEVPNMAIEKVYMLNNTSVIPDEVLSHRLGLIPLKANPKIFEYCQEGDTKGTEQDSLQFELKVKCSWNNNRRLDSTDPNEMYLNHKVLSKDIRWIPIGEQSQFHKESDVGPVDGDILIAKLRPGHEIDCKLLAFKGIGKDHAKFSPVSVAYYRLLPEIIIIKEIVDEKAERFQKCFTPGVIKIIEKKGKKIAKVNDARYDSCSRNVLNHEDLADSVQLGRVKDHFIFTIESIGSLPPNTLFLESINILKGKCKKFLNELDNNDF